MEGRHVTRSGTRRYPSGNVYHGAFKNGKRHGQGKCTFADGRVNEGQWVEGNYVPRGTKRRAEAQTQTDGEPGP